MKFLSQIKFLDEFPFSCFWNVENFCEFFVDFCMEIFTVESRWFGVFWNSSFFSLNFQIFRVFLVILLFFRNFPIFPDFLLNFWKKNLTFPNFLAIFKIFHSHPKISSQKHPLHRKLTVLFAANNIKILKCLQWNEAEDICNARSFFNVVQNFH